MRALRVNIALWLKHASRVFGSVPFLIPLRRRLMNKTQR